MKAYVFGAGASYHCGYPLASRILPALSDWLDATASQDVWMTSCQNRIRQLLHTFGSLDDFERILGQLKALGLNRVNGDIETPYPQCQIDIHEDCRRALGTGTEVPDVLNGFYPQYLKSELSLGLREYFRFVEVSHKRPTAYDDFAAKLKPAESSVITFNYDVALERALYAANKWDVGDGYGFEMFADRSPSPVTIYKLHGSVNWYQEPIQRFGPPLMFPRDLNLLGYSDLRDRRLGGGNVGSNELGTMILPDPEKTFHWQNLWAPLWSRAAETLHLASDVSIYGYSLPSADRLARELLFENIESSASIHIYCKRDTERIISEFRNVGFASVEGDAQVGFEDSAKI